jgi:hypothetical protein
MPPPIQKTELRVGPGGGERAGGFQDLREVGPVGDYQRAGRDQGRPLRGYGLGAHDRGVVGQYVRQRLLSRPSWLLMRGRRSAS